MKIKGILRLLSAASVGGGVSYGGVEVWNLMSTKTWKDYMDKHGIKIFGESESDIWTGIWNVHKSQIQSYSETSSKSKSDDIKSWCQEEMKKSYDASNSQKLQKLQKLKQFCSTEAFTNVNDFVTLSLKEELQSISEDDDYKLIFAIYRYPDKSTNKSQLLEWLNDKSITSDTSAEDGKTKLKNKCEEQKKLLWGNGTQMDYKSYYWWCTKNKVIGDFFKNKKAFDRAKESLKLGMFDGVRTEINENWKNHEKVKSAVQSFLNKSSETSPTSPDLSYFCSQIKDKKLDEKDVYQTYYLVFKAMCV